jgi:hypothetical protein
VRWKNKTHRFGQTALLWTALVLVPNRVAHANYPDPFFSGEYSRPFAPLSSGQIYIPAEHSRALQIPIGFTFNFFGRDFQKLHLGNKGVLTFAHSCDRGCPQFGETCNMASFTCFRSYLPSGTLGWTSEPQSVLAAFWDDLDLIGGSTPTEIRYHQAGAAPNRILIIEWRNMIHHQGSPSSPRSMTSFQAKLYEPNSIIELHYGSFQPQSDKTAWGGQIGIENHDGQKVFRPINCTGFNNSCSWEVLLKLRNRVLLFGSYEGPELVATLQAPTGARSGELFSLPVTVWNVGHQSTQNSFRASLSLEETNSSTVSLIPLGDLQFAALDGRSSVTSTLTVIMPILSSTSTYLLKGMVDSLAAVSEGATQNNAFSADSPLQLQDNIAVNFQTAFVDNFTNETILNYQVINQGPRVSNMEVGVFRSVDFFLDSADTLETTFNIDVPASPMTDFNASFPTPPQLGNQYLFVVLDPQNLILETNENDNTALYGPMDLVPELSMQAESSHFAVVGEATEFEVEITSEGALAAETDWEVFYSADQTLDSADYRVAFGRATLGFSRSFQTTRPFTIPMMPSGNYYVLSRVDPNNEHLESNETNNMAMDMHQTSVQGIDLSGYIPPGYDKFYLGQAHRVTGIFRNATTTRVPPFLAQLMLSKNRILTLTDPVLASVQVPGLEPSEQARIDFDWTTTSTNFLGLSYLGVVADSTNLIIEDNESNNSFILPTPVEILPFAPDYRMGAVSPQLLGHHGDRLTVAREIVNQGVAQSQVTYHVYLSPDPDFDIGTARLMYTDQISVAVNSRDLSTDRFVLPEDLVPGSYFLSYVIDPQNRVQELDESNNTLTNSDAIRVMDSSFTIANETIPRGVLNVDYVAQFATIPARSDVRWELLNPLPNGLVFDEAAGTITGKPSEAGHFPLLLKGVAAQSTTFRQIDLDIAYSSLDFAVRTPSLPIGQLGRPYWLQLVTDGGVPPISWTTESLFPGGLTLTSSGAIFGVPTITDTKVIHFRVVDGSGQEIIFTKGLRIVNDQTSFHFAGELPSPIPLNTPYAYRFEFENGVVPVFIQLKAGRLPEGLTIQNGSLRGQTGELGEFVVLVQATDSRGEVAMTSLGVSVIAAQALTISTTSLPFAWVGKEYKAADEKKVTLSAEPGSHDLEFEILDETLPPGLTLQADGSISGTATQVGRFDFIVSVTSADGGYGTQALSILVVAPGEPEPEDKSCTCSSTGHGPAKTYMVIGLFLGLLLLRRKHKKALIQ